MNNSIFYQNTIPDYKFIECYPYIENYCIDTGLIQIIKTQNLIIFMLSLILLYIVYLEFVKNKNGK